MLDTFSYHASDRYIYIESLTTLNLPQLTKQLMEKLDKEKQTVDQTKQNVSREEAAVNRENIRIGRIAAEAESDLAAALPSLESAIEALDALDKQDISEIRYQVN